MNYPAHQQQSINLDSKRHLQPLQSQTQQQLLKRQLAWAVRQLQQQRMFPRDHCRQLPSRSQPQKVMGPPLLA
jgi:hypothetical protein